MPRQTKARPSLVPYIVQWDGEEACSEDDLTVEMYQGRHRLAYKGAPRRADRDSAGVLWARMEGRPHVGEPQLAIMHPQRQYECMYALKCQVCKRPADRNADGWLFLDWPKPGDPPTWPEGSLTTQPPLCMRHARAARGLCPHAPHFVGLRVGLPRLWGVSGTAYRLTEHGWMCDPDIPLLRYGDPLLDAVLASQLVRQLRKVKTIPLH
ncbi:hypothetical protein ACIGW3_12430 [Streptomyces sp. NPDC053499]|uniref:hypothetical protein n=1 Tax=Streptomyces sp. NPDC053499 TaxID=3365707 RepID=UPI0037D54268